MKIANIKKPFIEAPELMKQAEVDDLPISKAAMRVATSAPVENSPPASPTSKHPTIYQGNGVVIDACKHGIIRIRTRHMTIYRHANIELEMVVYRVHRSWHIGSPDLTRFNAFKARKVAEAIAFKHLTSELMNQIATSARCRPDRGHMRI